MNLTSQEASRPTKKADMITLFLCGDVMTGRGIDQILPHPSDPVLHEGYMKDARGYVELAERANGPIPRPVASAYIWGDALGALEKMAPDLRIINLETSITKSDDYWQTKEIHYRMHPLNIDCLTAARIDVCSLANNHVLDWGYAGLRETLETLEKAGIRRVGAGMDLREAASPVVLEVGEKGSVAAFAYGSSSSGVALSWRALEERPGVNLLRVFSEEALSHVREQVLPVKQAGHSVVLSLHWGGNWGYHVSQEEIAFAHGLIDEAGVDILYGHSSHHVKGIEVYRDRLILYGCGDFLNDYEGIGGYEHFRGDLGLMYFVTLEPSSGKLLQLQMLPTRIKRFQVQSATADDGLWLAEVLNSEGKKFGTAVRRAPDNSLTLLWERS